MKKPEPQLLTRIAALARSLCDDPRDAATLSSAAEVIAEGQGRLLFEAVLEARKDPMADNDDAAIVATMSSLEKMMDANPGVAGYLMARLHPIAGARYLHATCEGIELWMWHSTSVDVAESLMRLVHEGVRPRLRKNYEKWADRIRKQRSG